MASRKPDPEQRPRNLVLVLGDQLDHRATPLRELDSERDAVWMAEVHQEATHVWCHKLRIAGFFAAMRHFRDELRAKGVTVHYTELPERKSDDRGEDLATVLRKDVKRLDPEKLVVTRPGDWRVLESLGQQASESDVELEVLEDVHFLSDLGAFESWAQGRKELVLESFYRMLRKRHDVLLTDDEPQGGRWNFDEDNRKSFGKQGPGEIKAPRRFRPDDVTKQVVELVERRFGDHPGSLEHFDLPVNRKEARAALRDFVAHRLAKFGPYEDAMWTDRDFLYHSRLSFPLNVKLLDPRECIEAAVEAYEAGDAPIHSVEGFVRQILGWREFIRGVYWSQMPRYGERNALGCDDRDVPSFYWDGETDMNCIAHAMKAVIQHGYAHHIQRLMVLGLFAQLLGVHPGRFHAWHMAMYVDAIDWVSLPNALGMSQWGDGGVVGTKPYCATGNYVDRMSNYCKGCRYDPKQADGEEACPFTTLYWDFLARHEDRFRANHRMGFQLRNLDKKDPKLLKSIRNRARALKARVTRGERI